jgi:DeoR/GlpR family transcriptional regulator of sugar metabolism
MVVPASAPQSVAERLPNIRSAVTVVTAVVFSAMYIAARRRCRSVMVGGVTTV